MVGICPPHYWLIDMEPVDGLFHARCKKCGDRTTYPDRIECSSDDVAAVATAKNAVIRWKKGSNT